MIFARICVKDNYEQRGDLVFRPLFRMYNNLGINALLDGNKAYIMGIIKDEQFHEIFTGDIIPFGKYEVIDQDTFNKVMQLVPQGKYDDIREGILNIIENKPTGIMLAKDITELAKDRAFEFKAYVDDLTDINPYEEPYNGYNDLFYKCKKLQKIK